MRSVLARDGLSKIGLGAFIGASGASSQVRLMGGDVVKSVRCLFMVQTSRATGFQLRHTRCFERWGRFSIPTGSVCIKLCTICSQASVLGGGRERKRGLQAGYLRIIVRKYF